MTPEENKRAGDLLRLREYFTDLADPEKLHMGVFWRGGTGGTVFINATDDNSGIMDLVKGSHNEKKVAKLLVNLRGLIHDELLLLLNELELELEKLGISVKPIQVPKLPPKDDSTTQQPPEPV